MIINNAERDEYASYQTAGTITITNSKQLHYKISKPGDPNCYIPSIH